MAWDAKDSQGQPVTSGVYYARLQAAEYTANAVKAAEVGKLSLQEYLEPRDKAIAAGKHAKPEDVQLAMDIFNSVGKCVFLKENELLDAITGLSGSGPAYIFMIVFLLASTWLFMAGFFLAGLADMRTYFDMLPWFALFFLPAVSMRLWAEDLRTGTMELLMTLPMKTRDIVLGKYLAALAFYGITLGGTLVIPVVLAFIGDPDLGATFGGYLAAFLLGGFYLLTSLVISAVMNVYNNRVKLKER